MEASVPLNHHHPKPNNLSYITSMNHHSHWSEGCPDWGGELMGMWTSALIRRGKKVDPGHPGRDPSQLIGTCRRFQGQRIRRRIRFRGLGPHTRGDLTGRAATSLSVLPSVGHDAARGRDRSDGRDSLEEVKPQTNEVLPMGSTGDGRIKALSSGFWGWGWALGRLFN
ncbi:hypothetical protein H6P81_018483 [Aristolochia fimbriata]|uniref:Uncharacterized protein n=1 Tax=Aristolochia fimbriata TaxID=158543 RepID=A0AAV7E363_ARIFI|nr:hypothetical protein H6P81_018483 [Aristolochia fimbriata]